MKSAQKKVDEALSRPWRNEYQITVIPEDEGGGISIRVPLLGSNVCIGEGDSFEEAENNLLDALEEAVKERIAAGLEVPRPRTRSSFSGTFIVRTTPDLHERLAREAERQGTSMNYLAGIFLERSLMGSGPRGVQGESKFDKIIAWRGSDHHSKQKPAGAKSK